jgi:DNA topoisomerase VI subunit B
MEPTDLTIQILKEIRDDAWKHAGEVNQRFEKMDQRFEQQDQRFEAIETALRDMAEQLVMLARGIKTALVENLERASS